MYEIIVFSEQNKEITSLYMQYYPPNESEEAEILSVCPDGSWLDVCRTWEEGQQDTVEDQEPFSLGPFIEELLNARH